jgi:hypothetical protein
METEQILGTVKSLRKDKTAVCLIVSDEEGDNEEWFQLAPAVKPDYIYVGSKITEAKVSTEVDEESGNRILYFIKCEKKAFNKFPAKKSEFTSSNKVSDQSSESDNLMQSLIVAQSVFKGTGKTEEFKKFQTEVNEYLKKGIWISTEKIKKSVEPEPEEIEEEGY